WHYPAQFRILRGVAGDGSEHSPWASAALSGSHCFGFRWSGSIRCRRALVASKPRRIGARPRQSRGVCLELWGSDYYSPCARVAERGRAHAGYDGCSNRSQKGGGFFVTYVIALPCVDVKDRACVDECPVD